LHQRIRCVNVNARSRSPPVPRPVVAKYKRLQRYDEPGHAHGLTFCCYRRQPFLTRDRTRVWFCEAVAKACVKHDFAVWAYVVMPEHGHLLVCPRPRDYRIAAFCASVKVSVGRRAVAWVKGNAPGFLPRMTDAQPNGQVAHRFWQRGGGHDRNLFTPEAVRAQIDYLHLNPVRRGLCEQAVAWAWSSARDYDAADRGGRRAGSPLAIDFASLPGADGAVC